jgi:hypothetical protein
VSGAADAKRVARGSEVGWLGRAGLAAKGVSYGIVGALALLVAVGEGHGRTTDRKGALQAVGGNALGKALLVVLALGFAGYAIWRFADALLDRRSKGDDAKGLGVRAGALARGVLYAGLCVTTVGIVLGASGGSGNEKHEAARVLDWPAGRYLVGAVGLGVLGAGLFNVWRGITRKFMKDLKKGEMGEQEEKTYRVVGVVGHLARGVVFCLIGWFLLKTAWQYDAQEAVGLDGALRKVARADHGAAWLGLVAGGLGAYGAFCLVQARYRRV